MEDERSTASLESSLNERCKELSCLYGILCIIRKNLPLDETLQGVVELIPSGFQYSDLECACIELKGMFFQSPGFKVTPLELSTDIIVDGSRAGRISVYYTGAIPDSAEGPFLKEEKDLIRAISDYLGPMVECKYVEYALVENLKKYRFMVENTTDIAYSLDTEMRITYISPQVKKLGYNANKMLLSDWADFIHPDDRDRVISEYRSVLFEGIEHSILFRTTDNSENVHWMEDSGMPLKDDSGDIIGVTGILRDITQHIDLETKLRHYVQFEKTLCDISSRLINFPSRDLGDEIYHALESVGKAAKVDHIFIYEFSSDNDLAEKYGEWYREGVDAVGKEFDTITLSEIPCFIMPLRKNKAVKIHSLDDLPEEAHKGKEMLELLKVRSALIVPLLMKDELMGFVGFCSIREDMHFSNFVTDMFRLVGSTIGNSLQHDRSRKSLGLSEMYYRSLFEESNDAVIIHDADGRILNVNKKACEMLGYDRDSLVGIDLVSLYPDEERIFVSDTIGNIMVKGSVHLESKLKRSDGSSIDVDVSGSVIDKNEQFIQIIVRDITDKKKAEIELDSYRQELEDKVEERTRELTRVNENLKEEISEHRIAEKLIKENETLLRNVLESTDDGISFFDNTGTIRMVNNKFREIWNIPDDADTEKNYVEAFVRYGLSQLENADHILSKVKRFAILMEYDSDVLYFRDGRIFEYHLFPVITDGKVRGHVCSYRNITMRKRAESDLQEYAEELERSNELKDLFTDIIRHDLMNPAGLVKGFVEILLKREYDPDTTEKLRAIKRNNGKLIDMIESVSKLSRLEAISVLEFKVMDVGAIVRLAIQSLDKQLRSQHIVLENMASGKYNAKTSPVLEEVFVNLLSNAIKYSPQGSKIIVDILDYGDEWKITVTDFGEGVADEDKPFVFERFKRATKAAVKGTGLGLAIVKRIIDLHGGKVGVEDNPEGQGSVFWATVKKA
ncbi:PAS domain S-box protein [Methanococcoides sp. FTZ1]|uniref:PAS domain S-box protein n=1 Tax=Methanococcoides sp. FTZ1 TaxID=3439061 RepID=UPI003F85283E